MACFKVNFIQLVANLLPKKKLCVSQSVKQLGYKLHNRKIDVQMLQSLLLLITHQAIQLKGTADTQLHA
jgi:hypothetical protein